MYTKLINSIIIGFEFIFELCECSFQIALITSLSRKYLKTAGSSFDKY